MSITAEIPARDRIIETALRLFYKQGYLATGINQIITESNVAKATFYSHFPSKEKLCVAYLQARHGIWMEWLRESVEQQESPKDKLSAIFMFLKKWMTDCDFRGCAFLNIASEIPSVNSEIRNEVVIHKDSLQQYVGKIVHDMTEEDHALADLQSKRTADMIYVLIEGAIVSSQNYHDIWPIVAAEDAATRLL